MARGAAGAEQEKIEDGPTSSNIITPLIYLELLDKYNEKREKRNNPPPCSLVTARASRRGQLFSARLEKLRIQTILDPVFTQSSFFSFCNGLENGLVIRFREEGASGAIRVESSKRSTDRQLARTSSWSSDEVE